ncbi:hypothetical protein EUX98_g9639 [Antrodiella citrinella]|uniref:JmjC domain-containing protein n=1 Tax=Antrodiella citrinella TaxID=2447956 RepID=A0A4V3XEM3_9APHY|nr:hypothetical protein EUX98_g9639 [Antrodiella citrinella]
MYTRVSHVPPYDEFYETYLKPNVPVIIGPALVASWPAYQSWATPNELTNARDINWAYLRDHYGHHQVTVADCANVDAAGNQERSTRLFADVLSLSLPNYSLYIKDWHLAKSVKDPAHAFYTTPDIFQDDWMNAFYAAHTNDDFRFVYLGPRGSFTPLHRDVYTSYSWSTNVCGRKRWWLFPPEQTTLLFMPGRERREVPYDVRTADPKVFTEVARSRPVVVDQEDGETLFV